MKTLYPLLAVVLLVLVFGCKKEEETPKTWNCGSLGGCVEQTNGLGFEDLNSCLQWCTNSGGGGTTYDYECDNGDCDYLYYGGGSYATLADCQAACGSGGSGSGYVCNGGDCDYVTSGAYYSTRSNCESSCGSSGGGSTAGYNCDGSSCYSVSSNATYSSLSSCENSCVSTTMYYSCLAGACYQDANGTWSSYTQCIYWCN